MITESYNFFDFVYAFQKQYRNLNSDTKIIIVRFIAAMEPNANAPARTVAPRVAQFQIAVNDDSEEQPIGPAWRLCKLANHYGDRLLDVVQGKARDLLKKPDVNHAQHHIGNDVMLPVKCGLYGRLPLRFLKRAVNRNSSFCRPLSDDAKMSLERALFIVLCLFPYPVCAILQGTLATWTIRMITTACHDDGSGYLRYNNATVTIPEDNFSVEQWIGADNNDSVTYVYWNAVSANDTKDTALRKLCFTIACSGVPDSALELVDISNCPRTQVERWLWRTPAYRNAIWGLWSFWAQVVGMIGSLTSFGLFWISIAVDRWLRIRIGIFIFGMIGVFVCPLLYGVGFCLSLVIFFFVIADFAPVAHIFYGLLS
ncbi:uncharacterized protein LOC129582328 [Paramacrobiotus metropolitanus]|uniref:uncharacterized protein LOC129582328 n=1 Tax=Paramacrobiotus metropolitanus TaxID=2943436 RepID=UPI0024463BE3|nr:uncharacterized protein LOC129582328 [Paramacrobiotus metropolitanus]